MSLISYIVFVHTHIIRNHHYKYPQVLVSLYFPFPPDISITTTTIFTTQCVWTPCYIHHKNLQLQKSCKIKYFYRRPLWRCLIPDIFRDITMFNVQCSFSSRRFSNVFHVWCRPLYDLRQPLWCLLLRWALPVLYHHKGFKAKTQYNIYEVEGNRMASVCPKKIGSPHFYNVGLFESTSGGHWLTLSR